MSELQKTISVKLYAMDQCNQVLNEWIKCGKIGYAIYDLKVLTNRQISSMGHGDVLKATREAKMKSAKRKLQRRKTTSLQSASGN